jgi:hypothetical protein
MENRKSERSELFVFSYFMPEDFRCLGKFLRHNPLVSDVLAPRGQDAKFGRLISFLCAFASLREINPSLVAALPRWALRGEPERPAH